MAKFGLIGSDYTAESPLFDNESTVNWFVENNESEGAVSPFSLLPTEGTLAFVPPAGNRNRSSVLYKGRVFTVFDDSLYEVFANGTKVLLGVLVDDSLPVSWATGGSQIVICSGGSLYVFDVITNTLTPVPPATITGVEKIDYCGGFFLALMQNSNIVRFSGLLDAFTWDPLDFFAVSVFSGNVLGMVVDHNEVWLFGELASTNYNLTGTANVFDVNQSAGVIEQGIVAGRSLCKLDNTIFWLGNDSRGTLIAWRAAGYTPTRVSDHALEHTFQGYARKGQVSDCVAYSYQVEGHSFWVLYFPTANATWVYDVAIGRWHRRGFWDQAHSVFVAHHSWNHVSGFGKHLVGDWSSGNLYDLSEEYQDDNGSMIRRVRRSPMIQSEQKRVYHSQVQIFLEAGLAPQPPLLDGMGNPREPELNLRFSNDAGKTWSNFLTQGCGFAGEFKKRVIFRRLGQARMRIYEISATDPVPWRIAEAYLEAEPGDGG